MKTALVLAAVAATAGSALAGPVTFLATQGTTLYRGQVNGGIQTFSLSAPVVALGMDPNTGVTYAFSQVPGGPGQPNASDLYRLDDPFGTPTLSPVIAQFDRLYTSFVFVGTKMIAIRNNDRALVEVDLNNPGQVTLIGQTGLTGLPRIGGLGYDAVNDVMYAVSALGTSDSLYTIDYSLQNGPDPAGTLVGSLGVLNESNGADFFGGTLYAALENTTSGNYEFGTVNTATGQFSALRVLGNSLMANTGLMVVPAPAGAGLLAMAALAATRRRR